MAALGLCAVCTLAAAAAADPRWAVVVISVGTFFAGLPAPATWSTIMDVSGKHTAVVSAVQNMIGNFGAGSCSFTLGFLFSYIQDSGADWNLVLYVFVGIYLAERRFGGGETERLPAVPHVEQRAAPAGLAHGRMHAVPIDLACAAAVFCVRIIV